MLHKACRLGDNAEVNRLLKRKDCDVNENDGLWSWFPTSRTPLYYAVKCNHSDTVKILFQNKTDPNISSKGFTHGNYPLHIAAENDNFDMVKILLENDADPNLKNSRSETPLDKVKDKTSQVYILLLDAMLGATIASATQEYYKLRSTTPDGPISLTCDMLIANDNSKPKVRNMRINGSDFVESYFGGPTRGGAEDNKTVFEKFNESLQNASQSVGFLVSPQTTGTGFRVGSCFLMTCWHVVEGMMLAKIIGGQKTSLTDPGVYVTFDHREPDAAKQKPWKQYTFDQHNPLVWNSEKLDVAILKLDTARAATLKLPTVRKLKLADLPTDTKKVHFIGYPNRRARTHDYCCKLKRLNPREISEYYGWSLKEYNKNVYLDIDNPAKVLYNLSQQAAEPGASGSPGFIEGPNQEAEVVAMHCFAYPDVKLAENQVPVSQTLEQGVKMKAIYDELMQIPRHQKLCKDIFSM